MEVIFSHTATETLQYIVTSVAHKWNRKVSDKFIEKVYKVIDSIAHQPYLFPSIAYLEGVRKAVITKQTSVIYKIHDNHIEVLYFWDNREKPLSIDQH